MMILFFNKKIWNDITTKNSLNENTIRKKLFNNFKRKNASKTTKSNKRVLTSKNLISFLEFGREYFVKSVKTFSTLL